MNNFKYKVEDFIQQYLDVDTFVGTVAAICGIGALIAVYFKWI